MSFGKKSNPINKKQPLIFPHLEMLKSDPKVLHFNTLSEKGKVDPKKINEALKRTKEPFYYGDHEYFEYNSDIELQTKQDLTKTLFNEEFILYKDTILDMIMTYYGFYLKNIQTRAVYNTIVDPLIPGKGDYLILKMNMQENLYKNVANMFLRTVHDLFWKSFRLNIKSGIPLSVCIEKADNLCSHMIDRADQEVENTYPSNISDKLISTTKYR